MTREQGTGNREQGTQEHRNTGTQEHRNTGTQEQGTGFGQLYFSLLMSVFFRSLT